MQISKIVDCLETETLSVTFSSNGLKYLSLKDTKGSELIDLKNIYLENQKPMILLLLKETLNFLKTGNHNMKLDLSDCTLFQQTVFKTVGEIGVGDICTYKGLGEILGKPGAARAAGSAVAKNPVSYFIPTHRVLPQKGIGTCSSGAGYLREKFLVLEGHDILKLKGNVRDGSNCCLE